MSEGWVLRRLMDRRCRVRMAGMWWIACVVAGTRFARCKRVRWRGVGFGLWWPGGIAARIPVVFDWISGRRGDPAKTDSRRYEYIVR